MLVTYDDYDNYWASVAQSNLMIKHEPLNPKEKHYYKSIEELESSRAKGLNLVVVPHPFGFSDSGADLIHVLHKFELVVLKAIGDITAAGRDEACNTARTCLFQILKKLRNDRDLYPVQSRQFTVFSIGNAIGEYLDNPELTDGWAGCSMTVTIGNPEDFTYNSAEWR